MSIASHEFRSSVDFNQNELRNATFQRLLLPPFSPVQGQIYYNTSIESPFFWDNIKWRPFGLPAVHIKYVDEATMFGNQASQIEGYLYHDQNLDIYYEYLGTIVGDITDYNIIGGKGIRRNILDQNSNPLIDRDNLQFNRLTVEDDLANNKTVITRPPSITIAASPPVEQILEGDEWINNVTWKHYSYYDNYWVQVGSPASALSFGNYIELDPVFLASPSGSIIQSDIDKWNTIDNLYNILSSYRSIFETDGYLYSGYLLNSVITITRIQNNILEKATNLTDLNTDWSNRLTLTYIIV